MFTAGRTVGYLKLFFVYLAIILSLLKPKNVVQQGDRFESSSIALTTSQNPWAFETQICDTREQCCLNAVVSQEPTSLYINLRYEDQAVCKADQLVTISSQQTSDLVAPVLSNGDPILKTLYEKMMQNGLLSDLQLTVRRVDHFEHVQEQCPAFEEQGWCQTDQMMMVNSSFKKTSNANPLLSSLQSMARMLSRTPDSFLSQVSGLLPKRRHGASKPFPVVITLRIGKKDLSISLLNTHLQELLGIRDADVVSTESMPSNYELTHHRPPINAITFDSSNLGSAKQTEGTPSAVKVGGTRGLNQNYGGSTDLGLKGIPFVQGEQGSTELTLKDEQIGSVDGEKVDERLSDGHPRFEQVSDDKNKGGLTDTNSNLGQGASIGAKDGDSMPATGNMNDERFTALDKEQEKLGMKNDVNDDKQPKIEQEIPTRKNDVNLAPSNKEQTPATKSEQGSRDTRPIIEQDESHATKEDTLTSPIQKYTPVTKVDGSLGDTKPKHEQQITDQTRSEDVLGTEPKLEQGSVSGMNVDIPKFDPQKVEPKPTENHEEIAAVDPPKGDQIPAKKAQERITEDPLKQEQGIGMKNEADPIVNPTKSEHAPGKKNEEGPVVDSTRDEQAFSDENIDMPVDTPKQDQGPVTPKDDPKVTTPRNEEPIGITIEDNPHANPSKENVQGPVTTIQDTPISIPPQHSQGPVITKDNPSGTSPKVEQTPVNTGQDGHTIPSKLDQPYGAKGEEVTKPQKETGGPVITIEDGQSTPKKDSSGPFDSNQGSLTVTPTNQEQTHVLGTETEEPKVEDASTSRDQEMGPSNEQTTNQNEEILGSQNNDLLIEFDFDGRLNRGGTMSFDNATRLEGLNLRDLDLFGVNIGQACNEIYTELKVLGGLGLAASGAYSLAKGVNGKKIGPKLKESLKWFHQKCIPCTNVFKKFRFPKTFVFEERTPLDKEIVYTQPREPIPIRPYTVINAGHSGPKLPKRKDAGYPLSSDDEARMSTSEEEREERRKREGRETRIGEQSPFRPRMMPPVILPKPDKRIRRPEMKRRETKPIIFANIRASNSASRLRYPLHLTLIPIALSLLF